MMRSLARCTSPNWHFATLTHSSVPGEYQLLGYAHRSESSTPVFAFAVRSRAARPRRHRWL